MSTSSLKECVVRVVGIQPMEGDHLEWQLTVEPGPEEQEASILLNLRPAQDPKEALRNVVEYNELAWLSPAPKSAGPNPGEWILDLDELRRIFPDSFPMPWFTGRVRFHPSYPTMSLAGTPRTGIEFGFDSSTPRA